MRSLRRALLPLMAVVCGGMWVSTASAQPAPGQPADPNSSPAGTTPQPGISVGTGTAPAADTAGKTSSETAPKKAPARVPWRGSNINMGYSATTTQWGVGRDYIGSDDQTQSFGMGATINYFLKDKGLIKVRAQTSLGFDVELTNSDTTTTTHEPQFRDLPLQLITSMPFYQSANKDWYLGGTLNGTVLLPTSPASQHNGTYMTASPRFLLAFGAPLFKQAPLLQSIFIGVSARYDHRFTEANVPVADSPVRIRQNMSGGTFASDQLTGGAVLRNSFRTGGFIFLDEKLLGRTLWFFVATSFIFNFRDEFPQIAGTQPTPDRRTATNATLFNVGVTYFPMVEWGLGFDYTNNTSQLGEDGQRRNFFYSPAAEFSASLILSIDAIYERLTGPERDEPYVLFGKAKKPTNTMAPVAASF